MVDVGRREDRTIFDYLPPLDGTDWREVRNFERYWVSSDGRIWSTIRHKMLSTNPNASGYPQVTLLGEKGSRHQRLIHWLVAQEFIGPTPEGQQIRHLDDNKLNNKLENLAFGTQSENNADLIRNGMNGQINKTHCPANHEYSASNTYVDPKGHRRCRECKRQSDRSRPRG